jgi:hypothetical protein
MKLIIETDLGHDPDDFFALCYFIDAGIDIQLITISPGDLDQVAIAKFLLKECNLNIPITVSNYRNKTSSGNIHTQLLKKYNYPNKASPDGLGSELINQLLKNQSLQQTHIFSCLHSLKQPDYSLTKYYLQFLYTNYTMTIITKFKLSIALFLGLFTITALIISIIVLSKLNNIQ